jgi:hypothetical protein
VREKEASLRAHERVRFETCVEPIDGDFRAPLDPPWVNAGSTQRQETAAKVELIGISESGD